MNDKETIEPEETTLAEVVRRIRNGSFYDDYDWVSGPALRALDRALPTPDSGGDVEDKDYLAMLGDALDEIAEKIRCEPFKHSSDVPDSDRKAMETAKELIAMSIKVAASSAVSDSQSRNFMLQAQAARNDAAVEALREAVNGMKKALEIAEKGAAECPINNGKQKDGQADCKKCGSGPSGNCQSMDGANDRAVGIIRATFTAADAVLQGDEGCAETTLEDHLYDLDQMDAPDGDPR